MSGRKRQKKDEPSEDEKSEPSTEGVRHEQSPDDAEDRCLLSVPPPAGAEALPVAIGSGAASASEGLTGLFRKYSPFKNREDSSKSKKPPCKKLKKESSFTKAKNAFRKTFRRSEPIVKGNDPELEEKRRRKLSDPTNMKSRNEPKSKSEPKSKKSLFGHFSGSTSKETTVKTKDEQKTKKEPKSKKGLFGHFSGSTSKETAASPEIQKKALSRRTSNQPSIGAVSVGFFNEALLQSESSGVPTESTSLDIRSGSSFSPDAPSRRPTMTKRPRPRSTRETDEEFSSD